MASTVSVMDVYILDSSLQVDVEFESFSSKNMKLPSVILWYIDDKDISEIPTSHCPSKFTCSGKNFEKQLKVLSGNNSTEVLETSSNVNKSIVK